MGLGMMVVFSFRLLAISNEPVTDSLKYASAQSDVSVLDFAKAVIMNRHMVPSAPDITCT